MLQDLYNRASSMQKKADSGMRLNLHMLYQQFHMSHDKQKVFGYLMH